MILVVKQRKINSFSFISNECESHGFIPAIAILCNRENSQQSALPDMPSDLDTPVMFGKLSAFFRQSARDIFRFGDAQKAATAVEFALVAPAFLATLIAIFQTTIFLFAQQTLQNAAVQAARLFMTGQAQNSGMTQTQLANTICPMIQPLFNCSSLMVNVQSYTSFASANASEPTLTFNSQGQVTNTWSYSPGTPGQVMVVQLIYEWPILTGPFGYVLSNLGNNTTEMMGVTSFRVEPY